MKKLYKVTIEMMAIGTDKSEALFAASSADFDACDSEIEEVTDEADILNGWESVLPWGEQDDPELECAEFIMKRKK